MLKDTPIRYSASTDYGTIFVTGGGLNLNIKIIVFLKSFEIFFVMSAYKEGEYLRVFKSLSSAKKWIKDNQVNIITGLELNTLVSHKLPKFFDLI